MEIRCEQIAIGFDDPSRKPAVFSFGRAAFLRPLYDECKTWGEFITRMMEKHPLDVYESILDWYRQAIFHILQGFEIGQTWVIDISKRAYYECNWANDVVKGGSKRKHSSKTRKHRFPTYYPLQPFQENRGQV